MRRLAAALVCLGAAISLPAGAQDGTPNPDEVVWGCDHAGYFGPTDEYRHGVLGDEIEYKSLVIMVPTAFGVIAGTIELPEGQVFEDIAPRCGDLDGDGEDEVITIIADAKEGARLAVYSQRRGPLAQTPPIGQGYRWLAPAGIADFDGDGQNDIAYVETPHLKGILRVWSLKNSEFAEIASESGFSNHRIGEDFITGGVRDCGAGAELVLPNLKWSALMVVRLDDGKLIAEQIGSDVSPAAIEAALTC